MAAASSEPVIHVVLMKVDEATYDRVAQPIADETSVLAARIPGARNIEVLGTDDKLHIMITSEWDDLNSWAHGEWNAEMQAAVVRVFGSASEIQARIYKRIAPSR